MRSPNAATASPGGRRRGVGVVGRQTVRKRAASMGERASMFCIQLGMAARAPRIPPTSIAAPQENARVLRDNFNLHLLHGDVVSHIFRGYGQAVTPGS